MTAIVSQPDSRPVACKNARSTLDELPTAYAGKRVLGSAEAAAFIGVNLRTLERLRARGEAPGAVRLSERKLGYSLESLAAWLAERAERPAA